MCLHSPRAGVSKPIPAENDQTALKVAAENDSLYFQLAEVRSRGANAASQLRRWSPAAHFISLALGDDDFAVGLAGRAAVALADALAREPQAAAHFPPACPASRSSSGGAGVILLPFIDCTFC